METKDYRLENIKRVLNARGIMANYLKTNNQFAARVWAQEDIFKRLLPKHEVSSGYFIVDLDYAYKTLVKPVKSNPETVNPDNN